MPEMKKITKNAGSSHFESGEFRVELDTFLSIILGGLIAYQNLSQKILAMLYLLFDTEEEKYTQAQKVGENLSRMK